jgi:serine/threonine protein kinase
MSGCLRSDTRRAAARRADGHGLPAVDQQTGQAVTVKVLHPQAAANARMRAAFTARTPPASPALLSTLDGGEANGRLYRITPYVEGPNLGEWLATRQGPPGKEHLGALVSQVAAALAGSVHGNLKPANLLLEIGGRVRLSDAGLPSLPGPYTAPEIAAGRFPRPTCTSGDHAEEICLPVCRRCPAGAGLRRPAVPTAHLT